MMRWRSRQWVITLTIVAPVLAAAVYLVLFQTGDRPASSALTEALGGDDLEGYARVTGPRALRFPEDHGPHPDYRNEWWYYTGQLSDEQGREFGFQVTFFRIALSPEPIREPAPWRTRQLYMGHFALTDIEGERFYAFERFARGTDELAGAQADPYRVWLGGWQAQALAHTPDEALFPHRLSLAADRVALDVVLDDVLGRVAHGDNGYSRKGPGRGDASMYYAYPRLQAEGQLRLGEKRYAVTGTAWMDREWSTSVLAEHQVGWDWFALQLDDGSALMVYQLRDQAGRPDEFGYGAYLDAGGVVQQLAHDEVELEVVRRWRSDESGRRYPVAWRLAVPRLDLSLAIEARLDHQEWTATVPYWEGAVRISGERHGETVSGRGYVELTGYD